MTVSYDASHRAWAQGSAYGAPSLTDKFECLKDIGDGSFGTVSLARVRNAGSHVARRGTMVGGFHVPLVGTSLRVLTASRLPSKP